MSEKGRITAAKIDGIRKKRLTQMPGEIGDLKEEKEKLAKNIEKYKKEYEASCIRAEELKERFQKLKKEKKELARKVEEKNWGTHHSATEDKGKPETEKEIAKHFREGTEKKKPKKKGPRYSKSFKR